MREIRVKLDKLIFVKFRKPVTLLQLDILNQRGAAVPEELPEDRLLALLFAKHSVDMIRRVLFDRPGKITVQQVSNSGHD